MGTHTQKGIEEVQLVILLTKYLQTVVLGLTHHYNSSSLVNSNSHRIGRNGNLMNQLDFFILKI